jgi:four helix bundle protein
MNKTTFEDLRVFQAAIDLMVEVYRATDSYPKQEVYGLVSQMRRAAVSVVSHIGEGQGRLTFGEWRQMLSQGRGSLFELEVQLIASVRLGFINTETYSALRKQTHDVGGKLIGLIRYVQRREAQTPRGPKAPRTRNPQPATADLPPPPETVRR